MTDNDRLQSIPPEAFIDMIPLKVFSDDEIAAWIGIHGRWLGPQERIDLYKAAAALKGGTITGVLRTALRAMNDLPPVPGDEA